jgi:hypothetical protein
MLIELSSTGDNPQPDPEITNCPPTLSGIYKPEIYIRMPLRLRLN